MSDPHTLDSKKIWVPLENNPEVMTSLAHKLGLSPRLTFHEPYSLTEPSLLALVPRPAHAILFLYPQSALDVRPDAPSTYTGSGPNEPVIWFKQTIGHACGLIGLLHCLTNGEATKHILLDSDLDKLVKEAIPLKPDARADLLYHSNILEQAHKEAAETGDSRVPGSDEPVNFAFAAFVRGKDNHLYCMEGWKKGPIDMGELGEEVDLFSEKALMMGPLSLINAMKASEGRFSCIALVDA